MNARARNFAVANEVSPVVYGSVDHRRVTYRLANGRTFHLNSFEARQVIARWAFAEREMNAEALGEYEREERQLYAKLVAELEA